MRSISSTRDGVRRPVVELRRFRRSVPGDLPRVLERPPVRQIRRDPRRPERVATGRGWQIRAHRAPLDHGQDETPRLRPPRQLATRGGDALEERRLRIAAGLFGARTRAAIRAWQSSRRVLTAVYLVQLGRIALDRLRTPERRLPDDGHHRIGAIVVPHGHPRQHASSSLNGDRDTGCVLMVTLVSTGYRRQTCIRTACAEPRRWT